MQGGRYTVAAGNVEACPDADASFTVDIQCEGGYVLWFSGLLQYCREESQGGQERCFA